MANGFSLPPRWNPQSLAIPAALRAAAQPTAFPQNFGWEPGPGPSGGWVKTSIANTLPPNFVQAQLAGQYAQYGAPGQSVPSWVTPAPVFRPYGSEPFARSTAGALYSPAEGVYVPKEDLGQWYQNYYTQKARALALERGLPPEGQTWAAPKFEKLRRADYGQELYEQYPDIYERTTGEVSPFINPDTVTPEDIAKMLGLDTGDQVTKPAETSIYGANWKQDTEGNWWYLSETDNQWHKYEEPETVEGIVAETPAFQPAGEPSQGLMGQPLGKAGVSYGQRLAMKGDMGLPGAFAAPGPTPTPTPAPTPVTDPIQDILNRFKAGQLGEGGVPGVLDLSSLLASTRYQSITGKDGKLYIFDKQTGNYLDPITGKQITVQPDLPVVPAKPKYKIPDFIVEALGLKETETEAEADALDDFLNLYIKLEAIKVQKATKDIQAMDKARLAEKDVQERERLDKLFRLELQKYTDSINDRKYARAYQQYIHNYEKEQARQARVSGEQTRFQEYMLGAQGQGIQAGKLAGESQAEQNRAAQERINAAQAAENLRAQLELQYSLLPFQRLGQQAQPARFAPYRQ